MLAAPKSCNWNAAQRYGSSAGMDEETREQIVEMLTRVGMMAEDLSVVALGAASLKPNEIPDLISKLEAGLGAALSINHSARSLTFLIR